MAPGLARAGRSRAGGAAAGQTLVVASAFAAWGESPPCLSFLTVPMSSSLLLILALKMAAGLLADRVFGEVRRFHPLVGFGRCAGWVERGCRRLFHGANEAGARLAGADRIIGVRNVLVPSAQNVRTLRERRRMAIRIPPDTRCDSSSPAKFARCSGSPSLTRSHGLAHRRPTGRRMPRPKERLFQDRRQTLATLFICSIIPGQFAFAAIRTTVLNSILPIGHALSSGCSATF